MNLHDLPVIANTKRICITEKTAIFIVNFQPNNTLFSDLDRKLDYLSMYHSENIQKIHIYVDFRPIFNGIKFYTSSGYDLAKIRDFLNIVFMSCRNFTKRNKAKIYIHFNKCQISYFGNEVDDQMKEIVLTDIKQRANLYLRFGVFVIISNVMQYYRIGNCDNIEYLCIGVPAFKNEEKIIKFQRLKKTCLSKGRYNQYTFNYKEPFCCLMLLDAGNGIYKCIYYIQNYFKIGLPKYLTKEEDYCPDISRYRT